MKMGEILNEKTIAKKSFFLNRLRGISYDYNLENNKIKDVNISFHIHDKKEDYKVVGTANIDFLKKNKKTLSHGILPGNSFVIGWVRIDDSYRGNNLGRKLVLFIEEIAKEKRLDQLIATSVMDDAKGFWKKMGYEWSGEARIWLKKL